MPAAKRAEQQPCLCVCLSICVCVCVYVGKHKINKICSKANKFEIAENRQSEGVVVVVVGIYENQIENVGAKRRSMYVCVCVFVLAPVLGCQFVALLASLSPPTQFNRVNHIIKYTHRHMCHKHRLNLSVINLKISLNAKQKTEQKL